MIEKQIRKTSVCGYDSGRGYMESQAQRILLMSSMALSYVCDNL